MYIGVALRKSQLVLPLKNLLPTCVRSSSVSTRLKCRLFAKLSITSHGFKRAQLSTCNVRLKTLSNNHEFDDSRKAEVLVDDNFLNDTKYAELFAETYLLPNEGHKVFVVQPDMKNIPAKSKITTAELQLSELCALVETLPYWTVVDKAIHPLKVVDKRHLFGKGKLSELASHVRQCKGATAVVVGVDMLNSTQLATLQDMWGLAVYDRYTVVLQIFRTRAHTKEAKLQVALAEIPYYRSRLYGMHSGSLDQQKGALNHIGGSGETFLETRKRLLHDKEMRIRHELDKLRQQRDMLRKQRRKNQFPVVAVVGYTNAGKTSLIKALTGEKSMQPRDQLFATLDVTLHAGILPNRLKVLYVDTVGFISDIPTTLVQSFAATLEDIAAADAIIHVRDISHPDTIAQKQNVLQTLNELNLPQSLLNNMIEVCNKIDLLNNRPADVSGLPLSVTTGRGITELEAQIQDTVSEATGRKKRLLRVPMSGHHLQWLYKEATIESTRPDESDSEKLLVDAIMTDAVYAKFRSKFGPRSK